MVQCEICKKGVQYGHNIRHNHTGNWEKRASKTRRLFFPNLHKGKVLIKGVVKNVKACASCIAQYKYKPTPKVKAPVTSPVSRATA